VSVISSTKHFFISAIAIAIFLVVGFFFLQFSFMKEDSKQLFVYILVFTFDGFSQIAGQIFGKRKFTGRLSPNKTVEGLLGGYITAIITSLLIGNMFGFIVEKAVIFCILICTISFIGDITASWYKRICRVKDYSNLIPGHGGVLDRFDSFIFAGAAYWVMNYCIVNYIMKPIL